MGTRILQSKPEIVPRSKWGARAGYGTPYRGKLNRVYYRATLHHDADKAPAANYEAGVKQVRKHQNTHMDNLRWADIGYHYLIAPDGTIFEGRPLNQPGAHVLYENQGNVGICVMGRLHEHQPTEAQLKSLDRLYAWLCWELDLDSSCLKGHMDYVATQCPGCLQDMLPDVRARAKKALVSGAAQAQPSSPGLTLDGEDFGELLLVDGQSYVPVRKLAEACGLTVDWDEKTKTVALSSCKSAKGKPPKE